MSRAGRDDLRAEAPGREPERRADAERANRRPDLPTDRLTLPRSERRETVEFRDRTYRLRGSESQILATVGAFRVVPEKDLADGRSPSLSTVREDLRRLADQGLVIRRTLPINREPARVTVLTREGKALLDGHQRTSDGRQQQYHAGLVKPRELAHDAQLYRLFQVEASRLEDAGAHIERVVLDYEFKRDYQTFLNRPDRPEDADREEDVTVFATSRGLPVIDGHLELPDLRIEYETPDGRHETRDLELVTEHYSRGQMSGKARAGFGLYKAAGAGRLRGGPSRAGGTPFDPHVLERL